MTGLIHRYAEDFNADRVIEGMMASGRWPRPGYIRDDFETETIAMLRACGESGRQLCDLLAKVPRNEQEICQVLTELAHRRAST